ncbi:MAG: hypothetical protein NXI31_04450 [bacterium]|nr:hypothetical protein [bacterium]
MRILAPLLCTAALLAQNADPLQFVPADCEVVIRMRGPAAWRREFESTGLGKAFASPAMKPSWKRLFTAIANSSELSGERRARAESMPQLLQAYGGEVAIAIRADWSKLTFGPEPLPGAALIALGPDPDFDLNELKAALDVVLPPATGSEITLGGVSAPVRAGKVYSIAGPVFVNGCLVLVGGSDVERDARLFFDLPADSPEPIAEHVQGATFGLQINTGAMVARLCDVETDTGPAQWMAMVRDLGFGSADNVTLTLFPDGHFVAQSLGVEFNGTERGLLGLLSPTRRQRPELLRFVPPSSRTWSVSPFDGRKLEEYYPRMFEILDGVMTMSREELEEQFLQATKLRLVEDVLALIGDEYILLQDPTMPVGILEDDSDEPLTRVQLEYSNNCLAVAVRNGETMAKNLDTVIRARGLHVGRKSQDYAGTKIYRLALLGVFPLEYAIKGDLLVIGLGDGEGVRHNVRAVLDRVGTADAEDEFEFRPEVEERLARMPSRWHGIEVASMTEIISNITKSVEQVVGPDYLQQTASGEVEDDPWSAMIGLFATLAPELARQDAATVVSVDYFTRTRFLSRTRW